MVPLLLLTVAASPHELLGARLAPVHDLMRRGHVRAAVGELVRLRAGGDLDADGSAVAAALLAEGHLAQGDLGPALALGDELATAGDHAWVHHARAELASAVGDPDLAVERFRAVDGARAAHDLLLPWRAGAALALVRQGERAEALALAHAQHDLARAAGTPYDVALALRVLATTDPTTDATTTGSSERAPRLCEALALLADVEATRLRAQLETDLAGLRLLDGDRDAAVALLRSAEAYAASEDLWPLQSRVRRLLDRMGEVPDRAGAEALAVLTAAERRVALLAVEGLGNRQIAEQLGVTVKAVEGNLSRVYRKLGLCSRRGLVALLASV
ncbi:helix-turn-helix transcriptional regulator [Nocardioides plantarum]|uniref:helix-turn-helix transcriptional regulator n=1 Tax=Nocardioides plantarum TaxID=29299 RepID=UPI00112180D5|nr:LuxR C-terminal-related transcriptional regulator [Nocardioides plantarum]